MQYDPKLFEDAHTRYLTDAKTLSDDDLAIFALVDGDLADRARAKRQGFSEPADRGMGAMAKEPVTYKDLAHYFGDILGPTLSTFRFRIRGTHSKMEAIEARLAALERRPISAGVKWAGIFERGQQYAEGCLITKDGSLWVATSDTSDVPGSGQTAWRLVVKHTDRRSERE